MLEFWERLSWDLKWFFELSLDGKPTPGRLRFIAEVLLELREIMLKDDLNNTWTLEACRLLESWIEKMHTGNSFDLLEELRNLKEHVANLKQARGQQ